MSSLHQVHEAIRRSFRDIISTVERHPFRTDRQLASYATRSGFFRGGDRLHDIVAARVHLGAPLPPDLTHDQLIRVFYCLGWMKGFVPQPEHQAGRGRCDLYVETVSGEPLLLVEVKSGTADHKAVAQVVRYRSELNTPVTVVSAPGFNRSAIDKAAAEGVQLRTHRETVHLLEDLAVWNLWREPRRLSVEVAA